MKTLKNTFYILALLSVLALGCLAQEQAAAKPVPTATPAPAVTVAPVALTPQQMKALQEANKTLELAKARAEKAQAEYEAVQAKIESIIASYRFDLNITGDKYAPQLQVIDQQAGKVGFLPLPPPKPTPANK